MFNRMVLPILRLNATFVGNRRAAQIVALESVSLLHPTFPLTSGINEKTYLNHLLSFQSHSSSRVPILLATGHRISASQF